MVLQVKLERVARNLRSYELAQMVGCDPQRWYKFEDGSKPVPPNIAEKVSAILGKPADELFAPVQIATVGS